MDFGHSHRSIFIATFKPQQIETHSRSNSLILMESCLTDIAGTSCPDSERETETERQRDRDRDRMCIPLALEMKNLT
jgi:hypothetical protein